MSSSEKSDSDERSRATQDVKGVGAALAGALIGLAVQKTWNKSKGSTTRSSSTRAPATNLLSHTLTSKNPLYLANVAESVGFPVNTITNIINRYNIIHPQRIWDEKMNRRVYIFTPEEERILKQIKTHRDSGLSMRHAVQRAKEEILSGQNINELRIALSQWLQEPEHSANWQNTFKEIIAFIHKADTQAAIVFEKYYDGLSLADCSLEAGLDGNTIKEREAAALDKLRIINSMLGSLITRLLANHNPTSTTSS